MILGGPQTEYPSPDSFLADVRITLFHSVEYLDRWSHEEKRGIPVEKRTPRSFVGWPSGKLETAISLIKDAAGLSRSYANAGTIYTNELVEAHPSLSSHKQSSIGGYEPLHFWVGGRKCLTDRTLHIFQEENGRFRTPEGKPYEIFLHCTFPLSP
jgi:hypothetical protein